jgi:CheY-like chemotaxis protein
VEGPLNIIIGFSELLIEEIPGKLNDEQRLDLIDILKSGQKALRLVYERQPELVLLDVVMPEIDG